VTPNWRKYCLLSSRHCCVSEAIIFSPSYYLACSKFTNVFGSSRLLGSLSLSPPGIRRQESKEGGKVSLAKEREHSIEVAAKCVNQAFAFASENLDSIGLPLTPKLAENMRLKLKGCESDVAALLDFRWKALAFEWTLDLTGRPTSTSRSLSDDRRV